MDVTHVQSLHEPWRNPIYNRSFLVRVDQLVGHHLSGPVSMGGLVSVGFGLLENQVPIKESRA